MFINYKFKNMDYDYEVQYEELIEAGVKLFAKNYDIPLEKAEKIFSDWVDIEEFKQDYYQDLYNYFEKEAHARYIDWIEFMNEEV